MKTHQFPSGKSYPYHFSLVGGPCRRCKNIGPTEPCSECSSLHWTWRSYFEDAGEDMILKLKMEAAFLEGELQGMRHMEEMYAKFTADREGDHDDA